MVIVTPNDRNWYPCQHKDHLLFNSFNSWRGEHWAPPLRAWLMIGRFPHPVAVRDGPALKLWVGSLWWPQALNQALRSAVYMVHGGQGSNSLEYQTYTSADSTLVIGLGWMTNSFDDGVEFLIWDHMCWNVYHCWCTIFSFIKREGKIRSMHYYYIFFHRKGNIRSGGRCVGILTPVLLHVALHRHLAAAHCEDHLYYRRCHQPGHQHHHHHHRQHHYHHMIVARHDSHHWWPATIVPTKIVFIKPLLGQHQQTPDSSSTPPHCADH